MSDSLLPYSVHSDLLVLPIHYQIREDALRTNQASLKAALQAELQIKKYIINQIRQNIKDHYNKQ